MNQRVNPRIMELLGVDAGYLLDHVSRTIPKEQLVVPSEHHVDQIFISSSRNNRVLSSLSLLYNSGRLAHTGYLSILPIDQGVEHTAGSAFAQNPIYFDPENILKLAIESGCSAVASTFGGLSMLSRKYAHKIPFVVKINHNELLTYPTKYNQVLFGSVKDAWNMGAAAIGATIYFGSAESNRQLVEIANIFEEAHELGMATILWCYTRNESFIKEGIDYHNAANITGQANYLGVTIQADLIKQKLPVNNGRFKAVGFGKTHPDIYEKLASDHPIDLCRYQLANCYMGRIGLINSGGEARGEADIAEAIRTAVINKRAGGSGLILGRKAFQRSFDEGLELLQLVQDVYLDKNISLA